MVYLNHLNLFVLLGYVMIKTESTKKNAQWIALFLL